MKLRNLMIALVALVAGVAASPAFACSPVPGYVRPSNFELAQMVDAIVVAQPVSQRKVRNAELEMDDTVVTFRILETWKGQAAGDIEISGFRLGRTIASDVTDIRSSHVEGHMGPCNRMTFKRGGKYLLFLTKSGDAYQTPGDPFSRESEDYAGPQSLWARTIRSYLEIQNSAAPVDQLIRLEALRDQLAASADPGDRQRAVDISDHLGSISPWKPTAFLLDALERQRQGRAQRYPARSADYDAEHSHAAAMSDLIFRALGDEKPSEPKPARDPAETRILEMLINGKHPDAAAVFAPFMQAGAAPEDLGLALRYLAANGRLREAIDLVESRGETLVRTSPASEAEGFLHDVAVTLNVYGDDPTWRRDAHVAARWPALALRLTRAAEAAGIEAPFNHTLVTLVNKADLRADPQLTLLVSGNDKAITAWAQSELTRPEVLKHARSDGYEDPLTLPLRIHLRWHGLSNLDGRAPLIALGCAANAERQKLFAEWGRGGGKWSDDTILSLSLLPGITGEDRAVLARAAEQWRARYLKEMGGLEPDQDAAIQKLAQGQVLTTRDIAPLKPARCPAR